MRELAFAQGSIEWHRARSGRVTGTSLKQAVSKNNMTLLYELIAERMTEPEIIEINSPAVLRGKELEPIALRKYSQRSGINFEQTGMLISDEIDWFGLSPDAVVREGGHIIGGLEIKCPSSKKHVEYLIRRCVPTDYFYQVIAPFIVSPTIEWWDFVSFDDRNYEYSLFNIRVSRDEVADKITETRATLIAFLNKVNRMHTALTF